MKKKKVFDAPSDIAEVRFALAGLSAAPGTRVELQVEQDGPMQGFRMYLVVSDGVEEGISIELDDCLVPEDLPALSAGGYAVTVGSLLRAEDLELAFRKSVAHVLCEIGTVCFTAGTGNNVLVFYEAEDFASEADLTLEKLAPYITARD